MVNSFYLKAGDGKKCNLKDWVFLQGGFRLEFLTHPPSHPSPPERGSGHSTRATSSFSTSAFHPWVGNIANRANTFLLNLNALCLWTSSIAVPSQYEVVGGWVWGEFGDRSYILRTKKPKTFETKTFAEPRGSPVTALVLACYLLGRKRSQTSYYSNNSAPKVSTLRWRWKRFSYLKRAERKKLGFWIYLPST